MAASTPIRVALVGLSKSAVTGWASAAHLPYLLSARGREKFEIVALLNSSAEAARKAIADFQFDSAKVRAYGDADALAADKDVDLVVCSTRVDKHADGVRAAIAAGKDAFVEWPLAENVDVARELAALAKEKGVRTVVGLQGRMAPIIKTIRNEIESGTIGSVLSVEAVVVGGSMDRASLPKSLEYFADIKVGGNPVTIGIGHLLDAVQATIGETETDAIAARLQLQRPAVPITGDPSAAAPRTTTSTVPDLVYVTAPFVGSATVRADATLAINFRRGQVYPGDDPLVWTIHGEKGAIRVRSPTGASLGANAFINPAKPVTIEVHDFASDKVSSVPWAWEEWQEALPIISRSTAALYEAHAAGGKGIVSFDGAVVRHEQLARILAGWDGKKQVKQ